MLDLHVLASHWPAYFVYEPGYQKVKLNQQSGAELTIWSLFSCAASRC
jgi:hypothetical protein